MSIYEERERESERTGSMQGKESDRVCAGDNDENEKLLGGNESRKLEGGERASEKRIIQRDTTAWR